MFMRTVKQLHRIAAAAILILTVCHVDAIGQFSIGFGPTITSGYSVDDGTGESEGGSDLGIYVWPRFQVSDNLQFGLRLSYFGSKDDFTVGGFGTTTTTTIKSSVIPVLFTGEYNFKPGEELELYLQAETGVYIASVSIESETTGVFSGEGEISESETYFSIGVGGGVRYWFSDVLGAELNTMIDLTFDEYVPVLVPVNLGLVYRLN